MSESKGEQSLKSMLFVSYSRRDEGVVRALVSDLARTRQTIWLDEDLRGGEPWWAEILQKIRECSVFVFALSNSSLSSKACLAELAYARDLGIPILPVQVGSVNNLRTAPISEIQIIDYREPTAASGIAVVSAIYDFSARRRDLPSPLPEPPPVPFAYLVRLRSTIEAAQLSPMEQTDLVSKLRECLQSEEDRNALEDARELLRLLRRRSDITYRSVSEIDSLLSEKADLPANDASVPPTTSRSGVTNSTASTQPQPPPLPQPTGDKRSENVLSILGITFGVFAALIFQYAFIFGLAGIICAAVGRSKKQRLANAALIVAIGGMILGFIFDAVIAASLRSQYYPYPWR